MAQKGKSKKAYVIPCSSGLRDAVAELAELNGVNTADIARSVMLVVPNTVIRSYPDPGEPLPNDREEVILKTGPNAGKPWRRKPRLQVRLPAGYKIIDIRRALGLALALNAGSLEVILKDIDHPRIEDRLEAAEGNIKRLRSALSVISYQPIKRGVETKADALYVLGFHPHSRPTRADIKDRFRMLAQIYHPDAIFGDTYRMSQLNAAISFLRKRIS